MFGLNAQDARDLAAMAPELDSEDFMLLPRFGVYAHLMSNGVSTGWVSGQTLCAPKSVADPAELKAASAAKFGRDSRQTEAEMLKVIGRDIEESDHASEVGGVGRRTRRPS